MRTAGLNWRRVKGKETKCCELEVELVICPERKVVKRELYGTEREKGEVAKKTYWDLEPG